MAMESYCYQICELMDEAQRVLATLEETLEEDFRSIRELRLTELYESNKRKEVLEARLRGLEKRWTELSENLGRVLGLPGGERTLDDVVARVGPSWRETLLERRDHLRRNLQSVREKGQANVNLLEHSLMRIDESLSLISHFLNPGATYGSGGKLDTSGPSGSYLSSLA